MVASETLFKNLALKIVFLYFLLFPFGQLLRFDLNFLGKTITIHPVDLVSVSTILLWFFLKKPKIYQFLVDFLVVGLFSLILSLGRFSFQEILIGALYLVRLFSYSIFFLLIFNLLKEGLLKKNLLYDSLIVLALYIGLSGWIQYIFLPDLTSLKYIGWDDHLNRLVGTFLDPGFTGIVLVLGALLSLHKYFELKQREYLVASVFLAISILFTYSRAGYLAFISGLLVLTYMRRYFKVFLFSVIIFISLIFLLPRPRSEGVMLERTASIFARTENYRQTLKIFAESPLFGVGLNNICAARLKKFGGEQHSHACSGSDSSLLFILATTGLVGFMIFLHVCFRIFFNLAKDMYGKAFLIVSTSLVINSLFINSLFYPWILGIMAVLLALGLRSEAYLE